MTTMHPDDAVTALGLINDYWPTFHLDNQAIDRWARVLTQTGADFDTTAATIATIAGRQPKPPTLADLCAAIRPRALAATAPTEPRPPPTTRGQAWARHTAQLARTCAARQANHDHHNGWQQCPTCTTPTPTQCEQPTCQICGNTP